TRAHGFAQPVRAARGRGEGGPGRRRLARRVRLAFVVQRYGPEVVGGAELHCRWVAEHLAARHEVEVLTTTATDYLTWENVLPEGVHHINGVQVRRFPVARTRRVDTFDEIANRVCFFEHTDDDEK